MSVYANGSSKAAYTISKGIYNPFDMTMDAAGNLYVINNASGSFDVTEYAASTHHLVRTINGCGTSYCFQSPNLHGWIRTDQSGNLYAVDETFRAIDIVPPGATSPSKSIMLGTNKIPYDVAFDAKGNLYVGSVSENGSTYTGWITVYAPGATSPTYTIQQKHLEPVSLAFDSSGKLYVGDLGTAANSLNGIRVYHGKSLVRTITKPSGGSNSISPYSIAVLK